jgi:hypothetical protein
MVNPATSHFALKHTCSFMMKYSQQPCAKKMRRNNKIQLP